MNRRYGSKTVCHTIVWIYQRPVRNAWRPLQKNLAARVSVNAKCGFYLINWSILYNCERFMFIKNNPFSEILS